MSERLPAMQALRAFDAAARARSLSRAAESLNLTHGAISHQIKALEADFGVRLVERAGRGIRLTDEGERFASRVRAVLAELGDAVGELTQRANPRRLRVSVMPSFAARWLLPRIGRFSAAHPDLDLNIQASNALTDFRREDVDVAIRYGDGGWPGLIEEYVLGDVYFPVCSPGMAGGRLPARPTDLSRHTLLRSEGESWKPWFEAAGLDWPEPERGPMFSDSSHTLQAAIEGQGIALARSSLIGNDLHNGLLILVSDVVVVSPKNYYLVYPPRVADSPKIAPFRKWLFDEVAMEQRQGVVGPKSKRRDSTTASATRAKPKRS